MRKILGLLGIVFLFCCLFVPLVSGLTDVIGNSASSSAYSSKSDNTVYGSVFVTSGLVAGNYSVTVGHAYIRAAVYAANIKMLLLDEDLDIFATSDVVNLAVGTAAWVSFTFSGDTTFDSVANDNITIALISDQGFRMYHVGTSTSVTDGSNSYDSPVDPHDATLSSGGTWCLYLDVVSPPVAPTATPTPTSAPSDSGDATLEYWGGVISDWIFPMLLVLVPAFLGLKFLGQTGFIIGLNIGVIIGYAAIPLVIGLWAVILVGLMDVVFIYMTRS